MCPQVKMVSLLDTQAKKAVPSTVHAAMRAVPITTADHESSLLKGL